MGGAAGALPAAVDGNRLMSGLCARDTVSITVLQKLRFFLQAMVGGKGALLRADEGCVLIDLSAA